MDSHWLCWEQVPAKISPEAGWVCGHPPATLCLSCLDISPFSLDPAPTGAWVQKPNLSHLSHVQKHQEPWGNVPVPLDPQAPLRNLGHLKPARLYPHLTALTGAGRVCPQEMANGNPLNCSNFTPRSLTPAWGGHKPASTSTGAPHNFPSSSSWRVQDPQHLPEPPERSLSLLTPSPGGSIPPCRGIVSSRSLCFPFRTAGGR